MPEPTVEHLLTVDEAIRIIDAVPVTPRVIELSLADAQGFHLAEPLHADRDYPPFNKSLMDGFTVKGSDTAKLPARLRIVGEIAAGQTADCTLQHGEAMAIMTGAPMPKGADGVVPVESSRIEERDGQKWVVLDEAGELRYITPRGADARTGDILLRAGALIEAPQLAVAASVGAARAKVYARPTAAVLATGDEIVPIDSSPGPTQIRNSNSIMLVALLKRMGCEVTDLGHARDEPEKIRGAISHGMQFDLLFVTGGMSMGEYDYVPKILEKLGVELKITKLRIKPGKPFVFGSHDSGYVFGLPGNPVSGFVCSVRLASRLVRRMMNAPAEPNWISGKLLAPLPANGPREFYQPAVLESEGAVRPLAWKGSADIYTLAIANCLLVRAENEQSLDIGQTVRVLPL